MSPGTATTPVKPKDSSTLGDATLLGTQLEVISELQDGTVVSKFQITCAVGLDTLNFGTLLDHFSNGDQAKAVELLKQAGGSPPFNAVLDAAVGPGDVDKGKDGFPNLRCIVDFGPAIPTQTFQVHTILDFTTTEGPERLRDALQRADVTEIDTLAKAHCKILDHKRVTALLTAALA